MPIRIGVVLPGANTTLEPELRAWFPRPVELLVQRIVRPGMLTLEDLPAERDRVAAAGEALSKEKVDLVVMGCTAAGFLAGPQGDLDFCNDLQAATGAPTVSAAGSMVAALRHSKAEAVTVVTPYGPLVNNALRGFLGDTGFRITAFQGFEVTGVQELLALRERDVDDKARQAAAEPSDAIFIACSQLPTYGVLGALARDANRPAWSSIKAAAWNGCKALGLAVKQEPMNKNSI